MQNDRLADRYRQLAKVAEDKAAVIQKHTEMVLPVNGELTEKLPSIQEEKGLYYAAAVIGELEAANKSLVDVHRNIKKVFGPFSQLNRLDEKFNVPAPVFAQRWVSGVLQNPLRLRAGDFSFR